MPNFNSLLHETSIQKEIPHPIMAGRGRPMRNPYLYSVENWIEFTSDSDSDANNVQSNIFNIEQGSLQSIQEPRIPPVVQQEHRGQPQQPDGHFPTVVQDQEEQHEQQIPPVGQQQPDGPYIEPRNDQPHAEHRGHQDQEIPPLVVQQQLEEEDIEVDEESESDQEMDDVDMEEEDYASIFSQIKSQWLLTEIEHSVSKSASEMFWRIAMENFPKVKSAQEKEKKKKIPQFQSVRNHMYDNLLPPIDLEIAYKNRETGIIQIVKDTNTPLKKFPPSKFDKLYEIGTIKVSYCSFQTYYH